MDMQRRGFVKLAVAGAGVLALWSSWDGLASILEWRDSFLKKCGMSFGSGKLSGAEQEEAARLMGFKSAKEAIQYATQEVKKLQSCGQIDQAMASDFGESRTYVLLSGWVVSKTELLLTLARY